MGAVYEALHEPLSRRVAIKTIREDLGGQAELLSRFRREAEASAALGHPNIVQVTDFITDAAHPTPLMVMELLDGRTLRDLVSTAKKLEPPRAVFIALQILSGLAAAHRAGIIHRDVKPANVFLQKTLAVRDHVKLLDFGLAKLMETGDMPVTQRGLVLGTRAYMAPEQEEGGSVDARSDLYAVGATLYYALSGRRPRDAKTMRVPLPLRRIAAEIAPKLAAVVDQALSPDPNHRYASAEKMAEALSEFTSGTTTGLGNATFLPGGGLERAKTNALDAVAATATGAAPITPSDSVESVPMTERDDRFRHNVIDSMSIKSAAPKTVRTPLDQGPMADAGPLESTLDDTLKTGRPKFDSKSLTESEGAVGTGTGSDAFVISTKKMQIPKAAELAARVQAQTLPSKGQLQGSTSPMAQPAPPGLAQLIAPPPPPESARPIKNAAPSFPPPGSSSVFTTTSKKTGGRSARATRDMVLLVIAFILLLVSAVLLARYFGR
jgi:serine/threonine protein kinase